MMRAQQIIATHPHVQGNTNDTLIHCVEECYACAQACTACADACVGEAQVSSLVQCIRACMDCADICAMAGAVATRRSGSNEVLIRQALGLCEAACRICAEECERHAGHHAHCRICAEACRACERACRDAGQSIH